MALINRNLHPPGSGFSFYQPQTNWKLPGGLPFSDAVRQIISHRKANPSFNLATTYEVVAEELDEYTCARLRHDPAYCQKKKLEGLEIIPPSLPQSHSQPVKEVGVADRVRQIVGGAVTLADWVGEGFNPVDQDEAERRARGCSRCPLNDIKTGFMENIVGVVADKLHAALEMKSKLKLRTEKDDELGVCDACGCTMKLKVWVPKETILANTDAVTYASLAPLCWIRSL